MASKRKTPRRSVRKSAPNKQRSRARHAVLAKRKRPAKPAAADGARCIPRSSRTTAACCACRGVHEIYYEECGNPEGKPALFVHGGPGAGCDNRARASSIRTPTASCCSTSAAADAAGRTPAWSTTRPGTWSRTWSSCASTSASSAGWCSAARGARRSRWPTRRRIPQRVSELVLRGIFMLSQFELRWFYQEGASALFPDAWENYIAAIPPAERGDLIQAFYKRLTSDDRATRVARGARVVVWEAATSYLHVNEEQRAQVGRRGLRDRGRAHRVPLLRQPRLPRARGSAAAQRRRGSATSRP